MGNLFSNKSSTKNASQDTRTTQSNLWDDPGLQSFLSSYSNQFGNVGGFNVPINQYQTQAPTQQAGVAAQLTPGFNAASTVAGQGITPGAIQSFMSPYVQNVVDTTRADFATQNARDLGNVSAQAAKLGALTGTQGAMARNLARESQQRTQDPIIAGLYNQGYNQAANTAAQSAGLQLQGAGTLGSLGNAATTANTGLGNLGQNLWTSQYQSALAPYMLLNQGVQGFQGLGNLSGMTSTGQSTGTGATTQTPSTGSILSGLIGTGLSFFADGGAVPERGKKDFAEKVADAYKVFENMRRGGAVPKYDLGGEVPVGSWSQPSPIGTEDDSATAPSSWAPVAEEPSYLGVRQTSAQPSEPGVLDQVGDYVNSTMRRPFSTGIWANQTATPAQRFGMALTQVGNGPFAGFGRAMSDIQNQRLQEMAAERAAGALMGKFQGQPTLDAQRLAIEREKLPAEIEAIEARSIDAQKDMREFENKMQRDLAALEHLRKTESEIDTNVMYGVISHEEGETRRQQARQLYQQQRGMIQDVTTPPKAQPTQPPGAVRKWVPDKGIQ